MDTLSSVCSGSNGNPPKDSIDSSSDDDFDPYAIIKQRSLAKKKKRTTEKTVLKGKENEHERKEMPVASSADVMRCREHKWSPRQFSPLSDQTNKKCTNTKNFDKVKIRKFTSSLFSTDSSSNDECVKNLVAKEKSRISRVRPQQDKRAKGKSKKHVSMQAYFSSSDMFSEPSDSKPIGKENERKKTLKKKTQVVPTILFSSDSDSDLGDNNRTGAAAKDQRANVNKNKPASGNRFSDSSSGGDFESLITKLKTPVARKAQLPSMKDFIVKSSDESDYEEDSCDEVFYAVTDRKFMTPSQNQKHSYRTTPGFTLTSSSDECSDTNDPTLDTDSSSSDTYEAPVKSLKPPTTTRTSGGRFLKPKNNIAEATNQRRPNSTGHASETPGFLKSLSLSVPVDKCHPDAKKYRANFKKTREDLTKHLFALYNENVFNHKIPRDMLIEWNSRLLKTAGYCSCSKKNGKFVTHIKMSVKVCDSTERVRDTLIHELCHAIVWLEYQKSDGHGRLWKAWASKANRIFPDLPIITVCHSYDIATKYTYKCVNCGYSIGRHSKSLDTDAKVCGLCRGSFQLMVNSTPRKLGHASTTEPFTPRKPNAFALYVKENYGRVKQAGIKHADVMKQLSTDFAEKNKVQ